LAKTNNSGLIIIIIILAIVIFLFKSGFQLQSLLPMSEIILNPSGDSSLVLYLNFDDTANPWKDSSIYNHPMIPKGSVALAPVDKCKYQTCADFTGATGDYLETAQKFNLNNGIAIFPRSNLVRIDSIKEHVSLRFLV